MVNSKKKSNIKTYKKNQNKYPDRKPNNSHHETHPNTKVSKEMSGHEKRQQCEHELNELTGIIVDTIKTTVDTEKFLYYNAVNNDKVKVGNICIDVRITCKGETHFNKCLTIVLNRDDKTGLTHMFILGGNEGAHGVLFSCSDVNMKAKIDRYLPTIINSTQTILSASLEKRKKHVEK